MAKFLKEIVKMGVAYIYQKFGLVYNNAFLNIKLFSYKKTIQLFQMKWQCAKYTYL